MIEPLFNQVVVKRIVEDKVGIVSLPDKARKSMQLIVQAVGPEVCDVKVGDSVICMPTDCMFFIGWSGVDEAFGIVAEDKIKGRIK